MALFLLLGVCFKMSDNAVQMLQKSLFHHYKHFSLFRDRELFVVSHAGRRRSEYKIDLLALRSPSERIVVIAWKWWLASFVSLFSAVGIVLLLEYLELETAAMWVGMSGLVLSTLLAVFAWKKGIRQQVFYSRHSGVPLVIMRLGKPSKNEFQKFVGLLEERIESLHNEFKLSRDQELAGEMRTLRRLTNDGIISLDEYENSKEVLFQKH